jgi:hypothetical protein
MDRNKLFLQSLLAGFLPANDMYRSFVSRFTRASFGCFIDRSDHRLLGRSEGERRRERESKKVTLNIRGTGVLFLSFDFLHRST